MVPSHDASTWTGVRLIAARPSPPSVGCRPTYVATPHTIATATPHAMVRCRNRVRSGERGAEVVERSADTVVTCNANRGAILPTHRRVGSGRGGSWIRVGCELDASRFLWAGSPVPHD